MNGANDPRWNMVDELRDEASRISKAAIEARRAECMSEDEALAEIECAHKVNRSATALVGQIGAEYMAGNRQ